MLDNNNNNNNNRAQTPSAEAHVRHQTVTHTPQESPQQSPHSVSMIVQQSPLAGSPWQNYEGGFLSAVPRVFKGQSVHKRASSGSSVASAGPPSPLSPSTLYPQIATDHYSPSYNNLLDYQTVPTAKSLSPAQDMTGLLHDITANYQALNMRRIHSSGADDRASYTQSTMSHDGPTTPQTMYEHEYDDQKPFSESSGIDQMDQYLPPLPASYLSPAYQQSLQDVFPDQQQQLAYSQQQQQQQQQQQPTRQQRIPAAHPSPIIVDWFQRAQNDHLRTSSPTSNPREKSPFRQNSPYNVSAGPQRPPAQLQRQRSSISPKELLKDEHDIDDDCQTPLIQQQQANPFYPQHQRSHLANMFTPNFGNESSVPIPQQYPFVSQPSRNEQSRMATAAPDFPPMPLISMECSTNEDVPPEVVATASSTQSVLPQSLPSRPQTQPSTPSKIRRPADTSSDSGTYSCTYRGCSLRFDTPAKLQKHKREGHRQASPSSTSVLSNLALRNSQAGPHRCDRLNPATGKPCNSIFSRPYDLTRHEDTIHNMLKQKVRCHLCTEDRTFSRSDALTRHMRVVHPDIDWAGKQKRKSHK